MKQALLHRPNVVLLDYHMPNGLGTEVLRELRGLGFQSPMIVMTAIENAGELLLDENIEGNQIVLTKPFDLNQLFSSVNGALAGC